MTDRTSDADNNNDNNDDFYYYHDTYDDAEKWCRQVVSKGHVMLFDCQIYEQEMTRACQTFHFPKQSLQSFLRNIHLIHIKRNAHRIKHLVNSRLLSQYDYYHRHQFQLQQQQQRYGTTTIPHTTTTIDIFVKMAKEANYPPYLLARYMVEAMTTTTTNTTNPKATTTTTTITLGNPPQTNNDDKNHTSNKFNLADAMRYPESKLTRHVIAPQYYYDDDDDANTTTSTNHPSTTATTATTPTRLAQQVRYAMDMDPMYGPQSDKERHLVGIEYEVVLEQALNDLGIPFETEAQLRQRGASRTPDVLLRFPVGVKVPYVKNKKNRAQQQQLDMTTTVDDAWKMVCWIDSKALFGDVNIHHTSVLPQLESYVHRFGPGMVIYWIGHAPIERLADAHGDVVIVEWDLPNEMMLPDGSITTLPQQPKQQQ